jgi:DNA-binding MarR family transcriptional regulator
VTPTLVPKRLPPQFASPAASTGVLLWQAVNLWQRGQRRALHDSGLSHLQVMLLASVTSLAEQDEPVTQVMLAKHARTDAMTTSQVIRALEKKKLVRRADHPSDSRAYALRPTAAGRRLARQLIHLVERADQDFFAALGTDAPRFASMLRELSSSE